MRKIPTAAELLADARAFWTQSATNKFIVVCSAIFLAQSLGLFLARPLMLNPALVREGFLLNFLSYGFLHGGFWHWALNMVAFYFAGNAVEHNDTAGNATIVFLGGTVCGGIAWFALTSALATNPIAHTLVGASAGIAALFAYFSIANRDGDIRALLFFLIPVKMRAWVLFAALAAFSAVFLAVSEIPSLREDVAGGGVPETVAHSAHLGGLLFGAAFALAVERWRERVGNVRFFRR